MLDSAYRLCYMFELQVCSPCNGARESEYQGLYNDRSQEVDSKSNLQGQNTATKNTTYFDSLARTVVMPVQPLIMYRYGATI